MRSRFRSEDEVVACGEVFDAVEGGGGGEGEEVDGAEDGGGEGEEEDCWGGGHGVVRTQVGKTRWLWGWVEV